MVMPFVTADCVTTDVIMLVVGGRAEAETNDVTMFVVLGSTVVVVSGMADCVVDDRIADETDEAMEEEMDAATDEDRAAMLLMEEDKLVTAAVVSDMLNGN